MKSEEELRIQAKEIVKQCRKYNQRIPKFILEIAGYQRLFNYR